MRTDAHAIGEARSAAYHRRIADRLPDEPELRKRARARAQRALEQGLAPVAMRRWFELLAGPDAELLGVLRGDDQDSVWLRSSSPFAGELPVAERRALWREAKEQLLARAAEEAA